MTDGRTAIGNSRHEQCHQHEEEQFPLDAVDGTSTDNPHNLLAADFQLVDRNLIGLLLLVVPCLDRPSTASS